MNNDGMKEAQNLMNQADKSNELLDNANANGSMVRLKLNYEKAFQLIDVSKI